MSPSLSHGEIEGLLGVYALDAIEGDEREVVELHLRECPRCRAEVAEHREVAALLAHSGTSAPEGVWDRILGELEPAPPALRMPMMPPAAQNAGESAGEPGPDGGAVAGPAESAPPANLAARRHAVRTRALAVALAAAAVIVAVLGIVSIRQSQRLDQMDSAMREVSLDRLATQALTDPRSTNGKLTTDDGRLSAPVVVTGKGEGYLLASKLPQLPKRRIYQLWGNVSGSIISLGVFDGHTDVVPFRLGASAKRLKGFLVTEEAAPGVSVSRNRAVLQGAI